MNGRSGGRVFLAALLAALGIVSVSSPRGTARTAAQSTREAPAINHTEGVSQDSCSGSNDPLCPVKQTVTAFFGTSWATAFPSDAGDYWKQAEDHEFIAQAVIALVPDPADSSFGIDFDRAVDAIRSAAERLCLRVDQYYLPWQTAIERQRSAKDSSQDALRTRDIRLAHTQPGAVLFRQLTRDTARSLLVLLVGETPTKGIHGEALLSALDYLSQSHRTSISIVGPTYSGSIPSLKLVLTEFFKRYPDVKVDIVSGSATNPENGDLLRQIDAGITYHTTVLTDDVLRDELTKYLVNDLHVQSDRVAVLVESNTRYGGGFLSPITRSDGGSPDGGLPDAGGFDIEGLDQNREDDLFRNTHRFPIHVSSVRNALEHERLKETPAAQFPRRFLQLSLQDDREASDIIHPMATLTTSSVDLQLASIVMAQCRRNVQYLGLIGTDIKDVITLAEAAQKYCPGLRLFTLANDIFLTHDDLALHGMIVASTYPLFWLAPWLVANPPGMPHFPTDAAHGLYNATLFALRAHEREADCPGASSFGYTAPHDPYVDGGSGSGSPWVWIGVIGDSAVWPLSVTQPSVDGGVADLTPLVPSHWIHAQPSTAIRILFWAVFVFAMLNVLAFCANWRRQSINGHAPHQRSTNAQKSSKLKACFAWSKHPDDSLEQPYRLLEFLIFLTILVIYEVAAPPMAFIHPTTRGFAVAGWLVLSSILIVITLKLGSNERHHNKRRAAVTPVALLLFSVLVLLGGVVWYLLHQFDLHPYALLDAKRSRENSLFAQLRHVHLTSGLSPIPAVLFLCLVCYTYLICGLRRRALAQCLSRIKQQPSPARHAECSTEIGKELSKAPLGESYSGVSKESAAPALVESSAGVNQDVSKPPGEAFSNGVSKALGERDLVKNVEDSFKDALRRAPGLQLFRSLPATWLFLLSLFCLWAFLIESFLFPFEGRVAHYVLHSLFWLAGVLILVEAFRYVLTWLAFRKGLRAKSMEPSLHSDVGKATDDPLQPYLRAISRMFNSGTSGLEEQILGIRDKLLATQSTAVGAMTLENRQCLVGVAIINSYLSTQLALTLTFLTLGSLLLMLAAGTYPFEFEHSINILSWAVVIAVAGAAVWVLIDMNRDAVRSRLSGTTPGRVTFDREFMSSTLWHGLVPLLAVAAARFPSIGNLMSTWFEPLLKVLHR